jgi:dTDP-4-amino-4,6-dideoxygalactose transaminase
MRTIAMLDLRREHDIYGKELRAAVDEVLGSGQYILGPAVTRFETAVCERFGAGHAVAVSSGTDALLCALMAAGVGPGDEVVVPSFTFFATAGTVARLGAKPVFVDIHPRTFNLDVDGVARAINPQTKAIVAVHLFGQCADMAAIEALAGRLQVTVIEDAAQAIGARYHGRYAGRLARAGCFSFYPTKNLGGIGEGGLILTDDAEFAQLCRKLRNHGESRRYHHDRIGGNFRLDSLKCAALQVKLRHLDAFNRRRREIASQYGEMLGHSVTTPAVAEGCEHVYHQYSILCDRRDELANFLKQRGVASAVYYPVPLHMQECFAGPGNRPGGLPVTESVCRRILSLPCHPMLDDEDVRYVAESVVEFARGASPAGGSKG